MLKDVAGLSYAEMAVVFCRTDAALRKTVGRSRRKLRAFLGSECYLYNLEGGCACRIKKYVKEVNLRAEYDTLRRTASLADFFRKSGRMLPEKNFWQKMIP